MEKIHLIKTPFWHKKSNLSENHKSKKFQAANSSMTYHAQNVDHLHDNSLSEANETVSDHTFGSETTFDESIETASLMSSISEESEANETVSDHTFGSKTTFDESIETASLMSSISEENTLDIPGPPNCEITFDK